MDASKSHSPTAIDRLLEIRAVIAPLKADEPDSGGNDTQVEKDRHQAVPRVELTTNNVSMYLQGLSGNPYDQIEALIDELRRLQEKLATDGSRIEQRIVEFARLNQSIMTVTKLLFDRLAHVQVFGGDLPAVR